MSVMRLNVARKVSHYRLAKNKAYVALFEAISNSIDSITERNVGPGKITVEFSRENSNPGLFPDSEDNRLYKEIVITDSGIGFTEENYNSFLESDSAKKEKYGGRGLGRFSWLKVFERVEVTSYFQIDSKTKCRKFGFERTTEGLSKPSLSNVDIDKFQTEIKFIDQKKEWEIPRKLTTFAERLIEHFLPLFIKKVVPEILLIDRDTGEDLVANSYFSTNYKGMISEKSITVMNKSFTVSIHQMLMGSNNNLVLLANNRAAKIVNLEKHIVDLESKVSDATGEFYIIAFVQGEYLDKSASPERDDFKFGSDDDDDELKIRTIVSEAARVIQEEIKVLLEPIERRKREKIDKSP
jgi:hypothetical protein